MAGVWVEWDGGLVVGKETGVAFTLAFCDESRIFTEIYTGSKKKRPGEKDRNGEEAAVAVCMGASRDGVDG